jgi:DNA-binding response OmpR family regulator
MTHALIVDDNRMISRAIESRLSSLGFNSFDHAWTEAQALAAAACRPPDLVVIGDAISGCSPSSAAGHIAEQSHAPILLLASGRCEVRRRIPNGVTLDGPFLLGDIENAIAVARRPTATQPSGEAHKQRGGATISDVPPARAA